MRTAMWQLVKDDQGGTATEYGLIAALVAAAIVGAVSALGTEVSSTFSDVASAMTGAASSTTP